MPLVPGSTVVVGLGLWNHRALTIIVEVALFGVCVLSYAKATRAKDRIGLFALWSLVSALLVFYFASLFAPVPQSTARVAWGTIGVWLFVAWSWWADAHRTLTATKTPPGNSGGAFSKGE